MSSFQFNGANYSSARAAIFARITNQRLAAERARHAGRQLAHDSAASSRAAEKRAQKRHEIANRPRGRTEAIGHRADGSPIYRAIPAFRARPYTPPADRAERPAPSTAHGIAAALKAEAPQPDPHYLRAAMSESIGLDQCVDHHDRMADLRESQRRARKVRAARIRRQGW